MVVGDDDGIELGEGFEGTSVLCKRAGSAQLMGEARRPQTESVKTRATHGRR